MFLIKHVYLHRLVNKKKQQKNLILNIFSYPYNVPLIGHVIKKSLNLLQQGLCQPCCTQVRLFIITCPIDTEKKLVYHKIILCGVSKLKNDTDAMQIF